MSMRLRIFGHEVFIEERYILSPSARDVKRQIEEYVQGSRFSFEVEIDYSKLTSELARFTRALQEVEYGKTITYGELGRILGIHPRKVGVLCARNRLPIIVPCHRIVSASGLGGYSYGVELKRRLLELERRNSEKRKRPHLRRT